MCFAHLQKVSVPFSSSQIGAWDGKTGIIPDDTLYWWGVQDASLDTAWNLNPLVMGGNLRYKFDNYVAILKDYGHYDFWNSLLGEAMFDDIFQTWDHNDYILEYDKNPYNRGRARVIQVVQYGEVALFVYGTAKFANTYHNIPDTPTQPYAHIKDPSSVGPGKNFTQAQKRNIIQENINRNNGVLRSDLSGEQLVLPKKSQIGVTPPLNEAQIDHIVPRKPILPNIEQGTNSYKNAQVLSRIENRIKSNKIKK
ncbi:MAG: hypothetical protein JW860_10495 [Sedimentisphaerales bacterium]|nr:hypothetical protein [Sedimentisphaerales bacterium]